MAQVERDARYATGTRVRLLPSHPHHGKTGTVSIQPADSGVVAGMYYVELDGAYEPNVYAYPRDIRRLETRAGDSRD